MHSLQTSLTHSAMPVTQLCHCAKEVCHCAKESLEILFRTVLGLNCGILDMIMVIHILGDSAEQFVPICPCLASSRWHTVTVLIIICQKIETNISLTQPAMPATQKPSMSDF
jgi:hypothetical protein